MRKLNKKLFRKNRVRSKISGTANKPRLAVFRSNRFVELQLIDDVAGKTLVMVSSKDIAGKGNKSEKATQAGKEIATKALAAGIKEAVFDRRHYRYHGRVRAVAEGARSGGLKI